jgi:hypothetical protein
LSLKIDGKSVATTTNACPEGGCKAVVAKSVDMAAYSGGAHEAELVATDGAGNTTTKRWTINVDPKGNISTEEATATLEAARTTGSVNTVGEAREEEDYEGTVPGLGFEEADGQIEATGTAVPTTVAEEPDGGITMEILEAEAFSESGQAPKKVRDWNRSK